MAFILHNLSPFGLFSFLVQLIYSMAAGIQQEILQEDNSNAQVFIKLLLDSIALAKASQLAKQKQCGRLLLKGVRESY